MDIIMLVISIVCAYAVLVVCEFLPLYRKKVWKDFWVNTAIGLFSFAIVVLICLKVKIPSPEKPIREMITSIFGK